MSDKIYYVKFKINYLFVDYYYLLRGYNAQLFEFY